MATWQALMDRQHGVATRAQLHAGGLSRRGLEALLTTGALSSAGRGLYRARPLPSRGRHLLSGGRCDTSYAAQVQEAVLRAGPGARAARLTAAVLWRFDVLVEPTGVDLDLPHGRRPPAGSRQSRRVGAALCVPVPGRGPLPVSSAVDTVLDCALELSVVEAVAVADSALRSGAVTVQQLRRAASARRGTAGAGRLWRVVRWCDPRSESVLESALRVVLLAAGCDDPTVQHEVGRRRFDLAWPETRLAAEADGRRWHDPEDRRADDRRRDNEAAVAGWRVLRFTWAEVVHGPERVVATVRAALAADDTTPAASGR